MATQPNKPKDPAAPADSRLGHFLLDPVPVPDVVESNTDTAWGLWEHTLHDVDAKEKTPGQAAEDAGYEDTVPAPLAELPPSKSGR